ncbi:hypothetical protein DUI87_23742 [Hirundo rustica rustica]|uniref:Retroviral nucleocapsid Gag protein p24 C-terminal domain-containing protein n=1 Tax=Hirundo rustica rustica TaxID=333673 RepID=A0A3M0JHF2_HIRRU|nr:hypothetical protein DUI87_23742 [Hirundo rustica rustica]
MKEALCHPYTHLPNSRYVTICLEPYLPNYLPSTRTVQTIVKTLMATFSYYHKTTKAQDLPLGCDHIRCQTTKSVLNWNLEQVQVTIDLFIFLRLPSKLYSRCDVPGAREERERTGRDRDLSSFEPRKDIGPEPIGSGVVYYTTTIHHLLECPGIRSSLLALLELGQPCPAVADSSALLTLPGHPPACWGPSPFHPPAQEFSNVPVSLVVYKGSRGGHNVRAVHHPFPQATIRDLCKAHRDYGRDSPYFRGLLRSDLEAAVVIPADLRQLFSCLLDSTEFKLWEAAWRQLLREALPSLLTDPETAVDENGNALTLEQLMGEGRWMDPTDQASGIPIKALQTIREHAVTAFFSMVPDGPVIPYYKIVQGTKEAFTKFVERLTRAIEVQVAEVAEREGILREMVFANATGLCRNAILSLPLDPPPTLQDMLRVCQLKVPYMQHNDRDTKSTTPRVAAISGTQQEHIHRPLELTKALHLKSVDWTFLSVNLKEQSTWLVQGKELVVIGDCFELQEEKVQQMPPWKYLGLEIGKRTTVPQKLAIKTKRKDIPKKDRDGKDPLSIIEWVFLSHQRSKRMTQPQELVAELIRKASFNMATTQTGFPAPRKSHLPLRALISLSLCLSVVGWLVPQPKVNVWATLANLSSKAEDVHAAIRQMREMVTANWLSGLFTNWRISVWASSIIKTVLLCLFILLLIMLAFGLLKRILYNLISATTHSPSVNHVIAPTEESPEEEGLELEEVLEEAPEDDGRGPNEEEHGLGYPTQHH